MSLRACIEAGTRDAGAGGLGRPVSLPMVCCLVFCSASRNPAPPPQQRWKRQSLRRWYKFGPSCLLCTFPGCTWILTDQHQFCLPGRRKAAGLALASEKMNLKGVMKAILPHFGKRGKKDMPYILLFGCIKLLLILFFFF